jgi:soluble lytic murein transglycosylase-like protein
MMQQEIIALARRIATERGLADSLVCAVCEQESGWNPYAYRYEPQFYMRYVIPLPNLSDTERNGRATSWGLLQVMGQTAREFGFANTFLSALTDEATGLEWGCRKLKHCMDNHPNDITAALQAYNGGSNPLYAAQVLARQPKYQNRAVPPQ